MENRMLIGIAIAVSVIIVVVSILLYTKKEHYDGGIQNWNWTPLKDSEKERNKCIAKPGKYFTPGL